MLNLRLSQFVISELGLDHPPPVLGWLSEHFAAHRDPCVAEWRVYHRQTGYVVSHHYFKNFFQARAFITVLECSGLDWQFPFGTGSGDTWFIPEPTKKAGRSLIVDFFIRLANKERLAASHKREML